MTAELNLSSSNLAQPSRGIGDTLTVHFLAEGAQQNVAVADTVAAFIDDARKSLDIAIYDCRLSPLSVTPIRDALHRRLRAGVDIRLVFDPGNDKPQDDARRARTGADFAERDTDERVKELELPDSIARSATGYGALMHHKYIVRDREAVFTGSLNWSDDSFTRMENVTLAFDSLPLASAFTRDFLQLWEDGRIENSGRFAPAHDQLRFGGATAPTRLAFSPGMGEAINDWVAQFIMRAERRIIVNSMLVTSSKILRALNAQIDRGTIQFDGVFDRTQTESAIYQWGLEDGRLQWKMDAVRRLVEKGGLIGKHSLPYRPGRSHNFMHNKTLVVDDLVITGSYNLSHSAQENAENVLAIESPALAEEIARYSAELAVRFTQQQSHHLPHDGA